MPEVGQVTEGREGFEWRVTGLRSLRENDWYESPFFSFSGEKWWLWMSLERRRSGRIELRLGRNSLNPALHVEFTLSVRSINGQRHGEERRTKEFKVRGCSDYVPLRLDEQVMLEMENEDVLTVVCQLRIIDTTAGASQSNAQLDQNATGSTSVQRQLAGEQSQVMQLKRQVADVEGERDKRQRLLTSATESASQSNVQLEQNATGSTSVRRQLAGEQSEVMQLKRLNEELTRKVADVESDRENLRRLLTARAMQSRSVQSQLEQKRSEVIQQVEELTRKVADVEADRDKLQRSLTSATETLRDFKELYLKKEDCDIIMKVKGQEFPAHTIILKARSPVLASALRSDMKEKATGIVEIEDCDPSSFPDFLGFIYCGEVDLSAANVFSLFTTADKYNVQDLRALSLEFLKQNLSVDNFCDTIALALLHSETELINISTHFFTKNMQEIIVTVKWLSFITENPVQGNELMIKAVVK